MPLTVPLSIPKTLSGQTISVSYLTVTQSNSELINLHLHFFGIL